MNQKRLGWWNVFVLQMMKYSRWKNIEVAVRTCVNDIVFVLQFVGLACCSYYSEVYKSLRCKPFFLYIIKRGHCGARPKKKFATLDVINITVLLFCILKCIATHFKVISLADPYPKLELTLTAAANMLTRYYHSSVFGKSQNSKWYQCTPAHNGFIIT